MDKNKSRNDLLAAGRKKLQQFRQKKDGKGSSSLGKSSRSASKHEQAESDVDTLSAAAKPTEARQVAERGIASEVDSGRGIVDSSMSPSMENSLVSEVDAAVVELSSEPSAPEVVDLEMVLVHEVESKPQRLAVSDHNAGSSAPIGGDSSWDIDAEVVRATPSTSEFPDSAHKSVVVDVLGPPALADAMEGVGVKVEKDDVDREGVQDLLPSQKDIPDSSLIEARGDQVTDVGAMQETNGLSSKQSAATLEVTGEAAVNEAKQTGNAGDISASPCPTYSPDGSSTLLALAAPDGMNPELIHQQRDDIVADRSEISTGSGDCGNDQQKKVSAGSGNGTVADVHGELYLPDATVVSEGLSCEEPLKTDDLSSSVEVAESRVQDGCSMSLSQLVEVIRGLGEDEYKFLLKSRGLASNVEFGTGGLVERMKEELYLTNCAKDIFHLQLAEQSDLQREFDHQHHQLLSEISKLHASLDAAHERNGCLAEDLVDCRSKLEAVTASKKEVQDQLHAAKAQVEEFSARADDLQLNLERSQADISSLSMEFSESKGQLATLQVENEKLSGMIASVTDERNKLLEEKESTFLENDKWLSEFADCRNLVGILHEENDKLNGILASLADEKKKLVEENQCCLLENEKLSLELADCQSLLAVQVVDNSNLSEIVILETEDRKKLEEEKESLAHENEKVCVELDDLKSLVSAMQAENANLIGGLSLVTDERKKLEEEKKSFVCENQRLSSELLLLQEQLSTEHGGIHKAKMREIDNRETYMETECLMPVNQVESSRVKVASHGNATDDDGSCLIPAKPNVEILSTMTKRWFANDVATGLPIERLEEEVFDDSFGFVFLKEHLEEAEKIMLHLEKAIERIQSHSSNLSRSSSKLGAPAVLKLIQAFESKGHHDEHEVDERAVTEDQSATDPFISVKEQAGNLRAVLKQLGLDAKTSSVLFKGVHDHGRTASDTLRELDVQYKALKEHNDNLEAANIELQIICEAVKQQLCRVEAKNTELEHHLEELKQREIGLRAENIKLSEKLSVYQSRVSEMHSQLDGLRRSLQEMDSTMHDQLNRLEKEESERLAMFEQEWTSYIAQIVEIVGRLDKNSMRSSTYSFSTVTHDGLDISNCIAVSVDAAVEMIEDLQGKLEAACADHEAVSNSYKELNEKFSDLLERNELAMDILYKVYSDLRKLVTDMCGSQNKLDIDIQNPQLPDPLDYRKYNIIIELLGNFLGEMLHLQSVNEKLNSELANRTEDIAELNKKYLDSSAIQKLIEEIGTVVKLEAAQTSLDESPYPYLEALVSLLVQKYIEVGDQLSLSREELGAKELALTEIQEKILQRENEFLVISGSLGQAEEALRVVRAELQEKANELEQSEQRVSSIREKLSIAVAKGKGLVVQRDSLKQSLAETSNELDKCSQELKLKDARLQDVETKLKTYSEAGERVEALESELSYIRNSATALRESFLLKDSVLQRIEEILEDLDLPEHFHSRDIIEKVDWLARSATGNSLPQTDWDQKSSVGGSYSDAGIVVMDAWKEDTQQSANTVDDLRRKYEELQGKFYGLAEQNEMLEQSLMERNHLVQRWEELMDRISMPSQLRSVEPEDKIEWLGSALSEAMHDRDSLQQKIDNLENYCRSLTADFEVSEKKISDIEADLQSVVLDREHLSERLENMTFDHEKLSARTVQLELENGKLQNEVNALQEKLVEKLANEECVQIIEGEIRRLQDLVRGALLDAGMMDLVYTGSSIECLEGLLRKIIENYNLIALAKPLPEDAVGGDCTEARGVNPNLSGSRESLVIEEPAVDGNHTESADTNLDEEATSRVTLVTEEPYVASLKKDLEEALHQLRLVKEERDSYMEKQQSLLSEVEALDRKREELLQLLNQEEQKSASIREKLNVAVRKGKSLVQQRDTLKQTIEQMNNEMDRMKSKINNRENALAEYEQKIRELTSYCEKIEVLESECLSLRNHLTEKENLLQERGHTLTMMLNTLSDIDVGDGGNASNPVEKLQQIGKLFRDLHEAVASSEQESRKSRRAAELLVAELNEVQERNDGLQEELARSATELAELSKQRDAAEAAKLEALSHLEKLSIEHYEEKRKQYSDFMAFKISLNQIKDHFSDISNLLSAVFSKDLEFLHGLEANMETCLKEGDAVALVGMSLFSAPAGITSSNSVNKENVVAMDSWSDNNLLDKSSHHDMIQIRGSVRQNLHELMTGIGKLKEIVHNHSVSLYEQLNSLSKVMETFHREMTSQKESFEVMRRDMMYRESIRKEKDTEIVGLLNNIALLCEACANSVSEIENKKAELVGNNMVPRELGMDLNQARIVDTEIPFGREDQLSSKEFIKSVAERLYLTVKEFGSMNAGIIEANQKEMKITIANLQKELQEKDIQKDRICMELVHQIKEAEATARSYSMDLQSSNVHMHHLEKQLEEKEGDRHLLELRVKELQDGLANMTELQERVSFLSDILVAKEQEIEALMQALDEEEVQMEDLNNKIRELEKVVQEKNLYLENLEVSRGKVVKKLSVTVSKFDELHHMSESLLAEVEKLQSQLQDRDAEISFLRQEVTRCTNEVLMASQMSNKRDSDEIHEFLMWFDTVASQVGYQDLHLDNKESSQAYEYKEVLRKRITSMISELENLKVVAQNKGALLEVERSKVEELKRREETLEKFLHEKESRLNVLEGVGKLDQTTGMTSEILEVEPVINKRSVPVPSIPSRIRSLRKANNDQVAIAIEADPDDNSKSLEEDDDKAHGFKSLTTSRIVPRFTRPVTDLIDGLWVSCDRTLMRQPALRLGIILYWAVMHALLGAFVV